MPKIKKSEIDIAEKKYRGFVEERDKFNEQARTIIEEKRILYDQKGKLLDEMTLIRKKKDELALTLAKHKTKRNELQKRAKELISDKRKLAKGLKGNVLEQLYSLQKELEYLEMKQQTTSLSVKEENKLIDDIRKKFRNLGTIKQEAQKQKTVETSVKGVDESIDTLFRQADEEHEQVLKLAAEIKAHQDNVVNSINEISHIIIEIRKKQEAIEKIKAVADDYHKRAMAMREKVITVKKERWNEIQEGRKILHDHHKQVRMVFDDKAKLDKAADSAMQDLLKKGRIELLS